MILIPKHAHSEIVRDLCWEAYQEQVPYFYVTSAASMGEQEEALSKAGKSTVADDAIVTGTTLRNLRAEVFRVTQLKNNSAESIRVSTSFLSAGHRSTSPLRTSSGSIPADR